MDIPKPEKKPRAWSPRAGKPKKVYTQTLHKMSRRHYTMLERACVEAYLKQHYRVRMIVSYLLKLPPDFPPVLTRTKVGDFNDAIEVSARALLKWLNKHGYSQITAEDIRIAAINYTKHTKEFLNELDADL